MGGVQQVVDGLPRLAITCWDSAWLLRRDGRDDRFRYPARLLDEAVERGFTAVSIDPFPHLIAPRPDGLVMDRFEVLHDGREFTVMPRKALLEFAALARERNLQLWLTSGFLNDTQARRSFIRKPRDFIDCWSHTLELLRQHGLLGSVAGVDFCQHFPLPPAAHGVQRQVFQGRSALAPGWSSWSAQTEARVQQYLLDVPRALKAVYPSVPVGLSSSHQSLPHLHKLDTSELDFVDRHSFLEDDPAYAVLTGVPARGLVKGLPGGLGALVQGRVAGLTWRASRTRWERGQERGLHRFADWCRIRHMAPVMTRGHVQVLDPAKADWGYVRDVSAFMVHAAVGQDMGVVTPALQASPAWPGLWSRRQWLEQMNELIVQGGARVRSRPGDQASLVQNA